MKHAIKCSDHNGQKYIMEQSEISDTTNQEQSPTVIKIFKKGNSRVTLERNFRIIFVLVDENVESEYAGRFGKLFEVFKWRKYKQLHFSTHILTVKVWQLSDVGGRHLSRFFRIYRTDPVRSLPAVRTVGVLVRRRLEVI